MTQSPYKICPRCGQEVAHAVQKCGRCGLDFNVPFLLNDPPIEEPIRTILTPRERQRIFEEEEARADARRQIAERERIYEEEKERRATEDHYAVAIGPDVPPGPQDHPLKEKGPVPPIPSVALVALLGFCLWAVSKGFQGEHKVSSYSAMSDSTPKTDVPAADKPVANPYFNEVFRVPPGTDPVYRVVSDKPEQQGFARYLRARIVVPSGLTREKLEANLRHAAKTLYKRHEPTGMFVFAYKQGTDLNGMFTAGRCEFRPKSKDKSDPTLTLSDFETQVDIADAYFQKAVPEPVLDDDSGLGVSKAAWRSVHKKVREAARRRIYYEIGAANDRASAESEARYPYLANVAEEDRVQQSRDRNQLEEDLIKRYETAVAKNHHITYAEVRAIRYEGMVARWPMPHSK